MEEKASTIREKITEIFLELERCSNRNRNRTQIKKHNRLMERLSDTVRTEIGEDRALYEEDSIAVASYALTMCRDEKEIIRTTAALQKDFDRMLINLRFIPEDDPYTACWKAQDWQGYTICPIGPCGFIYATRIQEDIDRLKKVYPCDEKGRFSTGIDDGTFHFEGYDLDPQPYEWYLDWVKKE